MTRFPLPLGFRYHLVEHILRLIRSGESLAVVGVAGVGKSNVVHYLQQAEVWANGFIEPTEKYLVVWVDSNDLTAIDEWSFFELLVYRLAVHCQKLGLPPEISRQLDGWHQKLLGQPHAVYAQRCFEQAIRWLGQTHHFRIVLLLDEFDILLQSLRPRLFVNLRALRDKNKYSLSYVLFLRRDLRALASDPVQAAFVELFQPNTTYLKPYDWADTELMIARLCRRQQVEWPDKQTATVYNWSGGHGQLIKILVRKILALPEPKKLTLETLITDLEVQTVCQKIWASLSPTEQDFLQSVGLQPGRFSDSVVGRQLQQKGILNPAEDERRFFSPLFEAYLEQKFGAGLVRSFAFDPDSQTCWIEGQAISLPALQAKVLELLVQQPGRIYKRAEILAHLYPDEDHSQLHRLSDDPRLYDVVKNLRKKIEPDPQQPKFIITVRGVGFKLEID